MENDQGKLTRRKFIELSAVGATSLALGGMAGCTKSEESLPALIPLSDRPKVDPSQKPNIIFLLSDQHRYDALGCNGNQVVQTPNIDSLAARGANFTNTHCASPVCQPSRASILTGLYPHQHGVTLNHQNEVSHNLSTMPRQLQQAGYKTALIGKAHYWNMNRKSVSFSLLKWGVDTREKEDYVRAFGFDDVIEEFDLYAHAYGKVNVYTPYVDYLAERGKLEPYKKQIKSVWQRTPTTWDGQTSVLSQEEDQTSFLTREATTWIKQRDQSRPFFLNLGYVAPHQPEISDPIWADYYKDKEMPFGPQTYPEVPNELWGKVLEKQHKIGFPHKLTHDYLTNSKRHYYGQISLIDQGIGDIIKTLEDQGIADNTWILYSADHGEFMGDHNLMGKKLFYQPSVRVPGIIKPPKGMASRTVDTLIEAIDLTATILDIAGAEPISKSSGQSLLPQMNGAKSKKKAAFSEIGSEIDGKILHLVSAATQRYRLTYETTTNTPCELFDLQEDPAEIHNLINDSTFKKLGDDMINDLVLPHMSA